MTYEIIAKKKVLFFTFTKKYKKVTYHGWPNAFQNNGILLYRTIDGGLGFINVNNYDEIYLDGENVSKFEILESRNNNQQQQNQPDKQEITEGQKQLLEEMNADK